MKLSKDEQKKIYMYLLGPFSLGVAYKSPLPDTVRSSPDTHSSFNIYESQQGNLRWKDHGDGGEHRGGALDFLMVMRDLKFPEAVRFYEDNIKNSRHTTHSILERGISSRSSYQNTKPIVHYREGFTDSEFDYWYDRYKVNSSELSRERIWGCDGIEIGRTFYTGSTADRPVFVYDLSKEGDMSSWKYYRPSLNRGEKSGWRSWNITPIPCEGYYLLPSSNENLFVMSSTKDRVIGRKIGLYPNVAVTGESAWRKLLSVKPELEHRFNNIFIIFDGDSAGYKGSDEFSKESGWINLTPALTFPKGTKDLAEVVEDYGYAKLKSMFNAR